MDLNNSSSITPSDAVEVEMIADEVGIELTATEEDILTHHIDAGDNARLEHTGELPVPVTSFEESHPSEGMSEEQIVRVTEPDGFTPTGHSSEPIKRLQWQDANGHTYILSVALDPAANQVKKPPLVHQRSTPIIRTCVPAAMSQGSSHQMKTQIASHSVASSSVPVTMATPHPITLSTLTASSSTDSITMGDRGIASMVDVGEVIPSPTGSVEDGADEPRVDVSQNWFTTKVEKKALQNTGHIWKTGQWSKEEIDILQINIEAYCKVHRVTDPTEIIFNTKKDERKDFYRAVAKGLDRPLFSVYRRIIRMYDQRNHIGKYTETELKTLKKLRIQHGNDWATIGSQLGRSASSVRDRCRLIKDTCNAGKWLPEEEKRLADAVYELRGAQPGEEVTQRLQWFQVAERVATRTEKQCRAKWLNYLNWKEKGGTEWTKEDDISLISKITDSGVTEESQIDFVQLSCNWQSVRSPQWLRGKWWSLKRNFPNYKSLTFADLLHNLSTYYISSLRTSRTAPYRMGHIINHQVPSPGDAITLQVPIDMGKGLSVGQPPIPDEGEAASAAVTGPSVGSSYQYEILAASPGDMSSAANSSATYLIAPPGGVGGGVPGGLTFTTAGDHIILQSFAQPGSVVEEAMQSDVVLRDKHEQDLKAVDNSGVPVMVDSVDAGCGSDSTAMVVLQHEHMNTQDSESDSMIVVTSSALKSRDQSLIHMSSMADPLMSTEGTGEDLVCGHSLPATP